MARWVQTCDGPDPTTAVCVWEQPDLLVFSGAAMDWSQVATLVAAFWGLLAIGYVIRVISRTINPRV